MDSDLAGLSARHTISALTHMHIVLDRYYHHSVTFAVFGLYPLSPRRPSDTLGESVVRGTAHLLDRLLRVLAPEDSSTGDKNVGACSTSAD